MFMMNNIYDFYMKEKYYIDMMFFNYINVFNNMSWDKVFNMVYMLFFMIISLSSIAVLLSKNPMHSVFFLMVVFLHVGLLLLLLHVEFLAFLMFMVYLGAIAVLFLFVMMMFNIHMLETSDNMISYLPLVLCMFLMILEMSYMTDWMNMKLGILSFQETFYMHKNWLNLLYSKDNIIVLSMMYDYFLYNFVIASLILLVAMMGAIMLTLNVNMDLKKQMYYMQNNKKLYNSLVLKSKSKSKWELWQMYLSKIF